MSSAELEEENKRLKAERATLIGAEKRAGSLDAELENAEKKVGDCQIDYQHALWFIWDRMSCVKLWLIS